MTLDSKTSGALLAVLDYVADRSATRIGSTREREIYTSLDLPPACSRRRFAELCRGGRVVGALRNGNVWTCSRAAWDASRRRPAKAPAPERELAAPQLEAAAADLLASAGLRVVRGGAR